MDMNDKQRRMADSLAYVSQMKKEMPNIWADLELGGAENQKLAVTFYLDKSDLSNKPAPTPIQATQASAPPQSPKTGPSWPESPVKDSQPFNPDNIVSEAQSKRFYAIAMSSGWKGHNEDINDFLRQEFRVKHQRDLTKEQYKLAISGIEKGWEAQYGGRSYE